MQPLIKKIHIYLGLLNFCAIAVFGIAGLTATFQSRPENRKPHSTVESRTFAISPNFSDKQVADLVFQRMNFPLSQPVPAGALRRDSQNHLQFDFWTFNKIHRITVLEPDNRLRIEHIERDIWVFLSDMHTLTLGGNPPYLPIRLWQVYNEFAIWSLILMTLSGVFLWLTSRPALRWAQYCLASGCGLFLALYAWTR